MATAVITYRCLHLIKLVDAGSNLLGGKRLTLIDTLGVQPTAIRIRGLFKSLSRFHSHGEEKFGGRLQYGWSESEPPSATHLEAVRFARMTPLFPDWGEIGQRSAPPHQVFFGLHVLFVNHFFFFSFYFMAVGGLSAVEFHSVFVRQIYAKHALVSIGPGEDLNPSSQTARIHRANVELCLWIINLEKGLGLKNYFRHFFLQLKLI